jgi:hypothetical protein
MVLLTRAASELGFTSSSRARVDPGGAKAPRAEQRRPAILALIGRKNDATHSPKF